MDSHTIEQDFDRFCLARIEGICEADSNHKEFKKKQTLLSNARSIRRIVESRSNCLSGYFGEISS